ncbi:MAG TPA: polymer-forming cytoskeletal protein [Candidatus Limnocylindria bacterium]|nr:polymer-forming cytoskeletal protein [Candidatus Limnocylindria bacterium]
MKKSKLVGALLLFLVPLMAWVGLARAQVIRSGDNTTVAANEVIDSSLYAFGKTIDIAGEVKGDVICGGQNVSISGRVSGDVICAGQTVRISGRVAGDVRAAGQTVAVGGEVKGNLSVTAQSFSLEGSGKVGGDAAAAGDDIVLNGTVGRDAAVAGATATLANRVGRNVKASGDRLTLSDQASVGGELSYTSKNEAAIASGAKIAGRTTRYEPEPENRANYGKVFSFGFGMGLYAVLSLLIVALALVLLFPHAFDGVTGLALNDPLKSFLVGLVASFAVPVFIVGLMVSVVGIPLALLTLLGWLLVLFLAGPFFAYFVGRLVWREQKHAVLIMLVGSLLVLVAYLIPVLGAVTFLAAIWLGTGMILRALFHRTPKPAYNLAKAKRK